MVQFTLDYISIFIGVLFALIAVAIIFFITKKFKKKKKNDVSLKGIKSYVQTANNHLFEASNNLVKLYNIFSEIEENKNE